jgi:membrane protein
MVPAAAMTKRFRLQPLVHSLWCAGLRWAKCDCVDLSAAFAYYTLQSIFPILLISLSIASWFLGRQDALESKIIAYASGILPPSAVVIVQNTLMQLVRQGFGAGLLGAGVLLLTAGNVYLTLQRGSARLWDGVIAPQQRNLPFKLQAVQFIRIRLEAFFVVILIGLLVVLDQLSASVRMIPTAALSELSVAVPWLGGFLSHIPVLQFGRLMVPFLGFSVTALSLQFLLPSRRVPFKPLIPGSLLIGFALTVLNLAVSRSILSLGARFQAYGVIGSVLVLTLWVWMVGVVIYFGQCWSVELAKASFRHGRDPNRSRHA